MHVDRVSSGSTTSAISESLACSSPPCLCYDHSTWRRWVRPRLTIFLAEQPLDQALDRRYMAQQIGTMMRIKNWEAFGLRLRVGIVKHNTTSVRYVLGVAEFSARRLLSNT